MKKNYSKPSAVAYRVNTENSLLAGISDTPVTSESPASAAFGFLAPKAESLEGE